ncbi:putative sodium/nucleoside cotransporter 2 isoform X2, partial [Apostichopus japonicus]
MEGLMEISISLEQVEDKSSFPPSPTSPDSDHITEWEGKGIPDLRQRNWVYMVTNSIPLFIYNVAKIARSVEIVFRVFREGFRTVRRKPEASSEVDCVGLLGFLYFAYLIYVLVRHFHEAIPLLVITLLVVGYSLAKYVIGRWGDEWKKIFKESKCMETSNQQKKVLRWAMYFFLVVFLLVMIAATGVFHSWIREPRRMVSVLGLIVMLSTSLLCSRHPTKRDVCSLLSPWTDADCHLCFCIHHAPHHGVSGAESFGAASNVFVGCSTAPLAIKPYLNDFTTSEMHSLMVGGLATIAGSVLAIYIKFGVSAAHLLSASIMSAPASLVVAKMFIPEVDKPKTANHAVVSDCGKKSKNCFEALYNGAIDGLKICGYIIANILTILCVLALINNILQWLGELADIEGLSFQLICRYVLYPLAWILGTDPEDCMEVAELIGIKTFLNEYIAYEYLSTYIRENTITSRSQIIVTYAICGFSHVGSIGVLLGGLAPLVPDRLSEISSLCVRALVSACIACFMTACVA